MNVSIYLYIYIYPYIYIYLYIYIYVYIHTSIYISMHLFYPLQKQIQFPPTLSFLLKYSVSGNRSLYDSRLLERFASLFLHLLSPLSTDTFSSFYRYFFLFLQILFLVLRFPFFHLYILKQEEFSRFCFIQIFKVLKSQLTKINFKFQHKGIESFPQTQIV